MNEEQRNYTVLEISKYYTDTDSLEKNIDKNTAHIYWSLAIMIMAMFIERTVELTTIFRMIIGVTKYLGLSYGIRGFAKMIENVSKKAGLENMITYLEYQMNYERLATKEENNEGPTL